MQRIDQRLNGLLGDEGRVQAGIAAAAGVVGVVWTALSQLAGLTGLVKIVLMSAPAAFLLLVPWRALRARVGTSRTRDTWIIGTPGQITRTRLLGLVLRGVVLLFLALLCSSLVVPAVLVCTALAAQPWRWNWRSGTSETSSTSAPERR